MTPPISFWSRARERLSPLVYLSNNWLSLIGVVLVTAAVVFWIWLLPANLSGQAGNTYIGIVAFLILPAAFFAGLAIIPIGIGMRFRRERRRGEYPSSFPPFNLQNVELRRLLSFIGLATAVNVVIGSQFAYHAVGYMETVSFCGQACHTVMQPEFVAHQVWPHAQVECVKCHVGPGATGFAASKFSGVHRLAALALNSYQRPIPVPIHNGPTSRDTCESCHWPQRFGGDRLRIRTKFGDDAGNTPATTVLMMHIGGSNGGRESGIHGIHGGPGVTIEYAPIDSTRQAIAWVRYRDAAGQATEYLAADTKPEAIRRLPRRVMDCVDCHNRPAHTFELTEGAVDRAMSAGEISGALPFAKQKSVELLKKEYPGRQAAAAAIPAAFEQFYKGAYPAVYAQKQADVRRSGLAVLAIFDRNVFPEMKVTWGSYPNNLGHMDFPGCFRCHDDAHASADGKKVTQDCNACHSLLAVDEAAPKVLADIGVTTDLPSAH